VRSSIKVLAVVLAGSRASAATLVVPTEYPTIHAAMAAASSGDTVLVLPGTYGDFEVRPVFGDVAALGFPIDGVTLASQAGPETTILDMSGGEGLAPSVVGLWIGFVGSGVTVRGFTITGAPESGGSGIRLRSSQNVVIEECVFELDNPGPATGVFRGGLNSILSSGRVEDCRFTNCRGNTGAGLWQLGGTFTVERTVFEGCQNEAMRISEAQMTIVRDCVFDSNVVAPGVPGAGAIGSINPGIVENCVFVENQGTGYGAVVGSNVQVRNCLFDSNHAVGTGAALHLGAGVLGNVIENNTIVRSMQSVSTLGGSAIFIANATGNILRNNIIAFSSGSPAVGLLNASVTSTCNVFWENADGIGDNYVPGPTDRQLDPLFCDPDAADWTLREGSPCLPEDPSGCGLIGAFPQGCGVIGIDGVSWGQIKNRYRDGSEER
jgi:hypothetical protein